jgi:hypothetical protein
MDKRNLTLPPPPERSALPVGIQHDVSAEAMSYLHGLFLELRTQNSKYIELNKALLSLEARVELAERMVSLTRDHLAQAIERSDCPAPQEWLETLREFRFVGVRLVDACQVLLNEGKRMAPQELLIGLNKGMFRFNTSSPLREIHAAMLKQNFAKKEDQHWVWVGDEKTIDAPKGDHGEGAKP